MRMLSFLQSEVCWVCYDGHTYKQCSEKEICSNFGVECLEVSFLKFATDLLHALQLMKNGDRNVVDAKAFRLLFVEPFICTHCCGFTRHNLFEEVARDRITGPK